MCSHEERWIEEAIGLAERLLDEVVRPEVEWQGVEDLAIALAAVAAEAGRTSELPEPPGVADEPF